MIDSIVAALLLLALFQMKTGRRFPALVFAFLTWFHCAFLSGYDGWMYFFTAGSCDIIIIAIIATYAETNRISDALITLSTVSIFANFYGWFLWVNYLPVSSYNNVIMALYLIAIFILLGKDCAHDYNRVNQRHRRLRLFADKCSVFCLSLSKKAGT